MKSRTLSKSEIKFLNQELFQEYGLEPFSKKDLILLIEDEVHYLRLNGEISFFYLDENTLIPSLKHLLKNNFMKKITVDMGAVKFVASGADIMRPGVVEIEENIHEGELITVIDINNKKPLAIGKALFNSEDMSKLETGKCIENVHYVGDKIWQLE